MAFEPAPLLIGLREGLEALLVLGIVLGMLNRLDARDRRPLVWAGFGLGILVSLAAGIAVDQAFGAWFEAGGAALFEVIVALAAVAVLSYMVLWMQRNARAMTEGLKQQVERAVLTRQAGVLAFLGFITVVREGLEVVLFYTALSQSISWADIALWGTVGFAASALLALAVFRLTVRVDLRRFFAVSGILLILIAAGLLVHVVHAMAELGWIGHGAPLWDTSSSLPDEDHWLGGPLHALVGYEDQPTLLQLVLYTAYIAGVGGYYLANLRPEAKRHKAQWTAAAILVVLLGGLAVGAAVPTEDEAGAAVHGHGPLFASGTPEHMDHKAITAEAKRLLAAQDPDFRVGLLVRSHGEPQEYNATTYESFKQFIRGIWPYTGLPAELLAVDAGTYYLDNAHPFSDAAHVDAQLVDAWLEAPPVPAAVPVMDPMGAGVAAMAGGQFHFLPGAGNGLGEGDVFEILGLGAYRTWLKMDNHSPKYEQTEDHFNWMAKHLRNHFGDRIIPVFAHSMDSHIDPARSLPVATKQLAQAQPDIILDSYHSSVFSDAMNTCMMAPHAEHLLREAGYKGPIVSVGMAGTHAAWGEAVAAYIAAEADHFHDGESVSIYLAQHGGRPGSSNPCGSGPDQYHGNLDQQFEVTRAAVERHFGERFTIRHVYGQGADEADDGELSPLEALELDAAAGTNHVVIIPYEFWGDAMDNLVALREGLGFKPEQAPYYDANHETHTTINGVHVDVWSAHYGVPEKGTAHLARISQAIVAALQ